MKNIKLNIKNFGATLVASFVFLIAHSALAQTMVLPSYAPNNLVTGLTSGVTGLNTAMIQGSTTGTGTVTQLFATVYLDASGSSYIYFNDLASSTVGSASLTASPSATPDVIICNSGVSPDYYTVIVSYPSGTHVYVDYFGFYDYGSYISPTFPTSPTSTSATHLLSSPNTVHVDGIVDYGNVSSTGFPYTEFFVVVWDDGSGDIFAEYINADNPPPYLSGTSITNALGNYGVYPDVAAIKRTVGMQPHDMALISYTDAAGANLYYQEWDISISTVYSATTIETIATAGDVIAIPRIDAIDNYYNNGTGSGNSYYKVASQYYNSTSGYNEVHTDDNLGSWIPSSVISYSALNPPPYNNYAPTVALSGPAPSGSSPYTFDGTRYMVANYTNNNLGRDIVMMEPIDYGTYNTLATPPNRYYWVSQNPPHSSAGYHASCVSSDCNFISNCGLVAWALYNPISTNYDIWYKITGYPYAFRQSNLTGINSVTGKTFQLFPNPACDYLTIDITENASYTITDMTGRNLLQGNVSNGRQTININMLAPGNYLLNAITSDGVINTLKFVKE